jgi:predicted house-cleaning noncanonical NTP pyrophosphatase (MazG superfamily)
MANYKVVFTIHVPDTGEETHELAAFVEDIKHVIAAQGFNLKTRIEMIRTQGFPSRGKVAREDR